MRRSPSTVLTGLAGVLLAATVLATAPAAPARAAGTWTFPGGCGGKTTLQECIGWAFPGDTIIVQTDAPLAESLTIDKTLTIEAGAGYAPVIAGSAFITLGSGTQQVSLSGITFDLHVSVTLSGGSGHSVNLTDVRATSDDTWPGLQLDVGVPASISVTGGTYTVGGTGDGVALYAHQAGSASFSMIGSQVTGHGHSGTHGGIDVLSAGTSVLSADLMNNLVWDLNKSPSGGSSGIHLYTYDTAALDGNVVGNTVWRARTNALYVLNGGSGGSVVTLDVFDNVLGRSQRGIYLDTYGDELTARAGRNAFWANAEPNIWHRQPKGVGNVTSDPRFVDAAGGDFHLQADSPLVNAGLTCSPGGVAIRDADGLSRVAGDGVDIGAYERKAVAISGQVFLGTAADDSISGTNGRDILCGFGGHDSISGNGGNDFIDGGGGPDLLFGNAGADVIHGGPKNDALFGGNGIDRLFGDKGSEPCLYSKDGVNGNDRVDGGPGTDGALTDPGDVRVSVEFNSPCN